MPHIYPGQLVEVIGGDFENNWSLVGSLGVVVANRNQDRFEVVVEHEGGTRRTWFKREAVRGWEEAPTDNTEALERWLAS